VFCLAESQPLEVPQNCACSNPLKTPKQTKLNKCYFCQVDETWQATPYNEKSLLTFLYVMKKQIGDLGILATVETKILRLYGKNYLVYRLKNGAGQYGYQVIDCNGAKLFAYPKHEDGFFFAILGDIEGDLWIACEGLATAISIKLALPNATVVICGNAGNLIKCAKMHKINFYAADNDKNHVGLIKANEAAKISLASLWYSPVDSDFNDLHCQQGLQAVTASFLADIFSPNSLQLLAKKHGVNYRQNYGDLSELPIFEGVTILSAKMGRGKTKHYMRKVRDSVDSCVAIAHLKALVNGLAKGLHCAYYDDISKEDYQDSPFFYLACCLNSIHKFEAAFEAVLLDEFDAALDALAFSDTMKDDTRKEIYQSLTRMVASAKFSIFASATYLPEHIEIIIEIAQKVGLPVTIVEDMVIPRKSLILENIGEFDQQRKQSLAQNRNVASFDTWKSRVEAMDGDENINSISVHSDNSLENSPIITSEMIKEYQHVILSPSAMAGFSVEVPHIDDVFLNMNGQTEISPLSACQFLARIRTVDSVTVCLGGGKERLSASYFKTVAQILREKRGSLAESKRVTLMSECESDYEIEQKMADFMAMPFTDYDVFSATLKKAKADLFANYNDNFLYFAKMLGYEITDNRTNLTDLDKTAQKEINLAVSEIKDKHFQEQADSNLADYDIDLLRQKAESKADLSKDERDALAKDRHLNVFGVADFDTIKEVANDNLFVKAKKFALLRCYEYATSKMITDLVAIETEKKSTANTFNIIAEHQLLTALLKLVNVTIDDNGDYDFTEVVAINADSDFSEIDDLIKRHSGTLNLTRYEAKGHKAALRLLRNWLDFEVFAKKVKGRGYSYITKGLSNQLTLRGGNKILADLVAKTKITLQNELVLFCVNEVSNKPITQNGTTVCYDNSECDHKTHFHYISDDIYCSVCHKYLWDWSIDQQIAVLAENSDFKPLPTMPYLESEVLYHLNEK